MQRTQSQVLATAAKGATVRRHCFANMRAAWKYSYGTARFFNNEGVRFQDSKSVLKALLPQYRVRPL